MSPSEIREHLRQLAAQYPPGLQERQTRDIPRIAYHIGLAMDAVRPRPPSELEICDLGGGIGLFSAGCAACGMKRVVLADDFNDPVNLQTGAGILGLHRRLGVEVASRDVVAEGLQGIPGAFDVVTSFDSMEHWHHSPKRLFAEVAERLKPGGAFILGVPNCVNLRKRITVPLGRGKWSAMQDWYEPERFRGHVREPDVADLVYMARDMGLIRHRILGRNWMGYASANPAVRLVTPFVDRLLRLRPQLCADIYLSGWKKS